MRYTIQLTVAAAVAGALVLACGEGTAPSSQQAQVLAAEQEQLGAMVDSDFGGAGAMATDAATRPPAAPASRRTSRPRPPTPRRRSGAGCASSPAAPARFIIAT